MLWQVAYKQQVAWKSVAQWSNFSPLLRASGYIAEDIYLNSRDGPFSQGETAHILENTSSKSELTACEGNVSRTFVFGGRLTKQAAEILHFQHPYEFDFKKNKSNGHKFIWFYHFITPIKLFSVPKKLEK